MTTQPVVTQLALSDLPGVQEVVVDLLTKQAQVTYDPTQVGLAKMTDAVIKAGYNIAQDTSDEQYPLDHDDKVSPPYAQVMSRPNPPQYPIPQRASSRGHLRQKAITGLRPRLYALTLLLVYGLGLGSGYLVWGRFPAGVVKTSAETSGTADPASHPSSESRLKPALPADPNILPADYTLPTSFGDIGPQLLAAGAIDYERFLQIYRQAGQPLSEEQQTLLTEGSDRPMVINRENAYFLLNFFWALGLTNQNSLLTEGPMQQYSKGDIGRFASTGGWTLGAKPATALYASTPLITLTPEQQARLEEVAAAVYRPCCNNPTAFPDCNHGMAMLGLLELLAAQNATADEMFEAAKYANAFWFPQQSFEIAIFFKTIQGQDFAEVDARELVGAKVSSGSGFRTVHQWLVMNNLLEHAPNNGSRCGV
jgi:hypothetical protein